MRKQCKTARMTRDVQDTERHTELSEMQDDSTRWVIATADTHSFEANKDTGKEVQRQNVLSHVERRLLHVSFVGPCMTTIGWFT